MSACAHKTHLPSPLGRLIKSLWGYHTYPIYLQDNNTPIDNAPQGIFFGITHEKF
jgi:hypothetical protein